jgi:hypothetical protein
MSEDAGWRDEASLPLEPIYPRKSSNCSQKPKSEFSLVIFLENVALEFDLTLMFLFNMKLKLEPKLMSI